ncbi:MAG: c-type cytochrome, partial [Cyanobacteria bacterium P01_D01_bin.116]
NKSLSKADLEKYDMHSVEKITYQVTNGKNAMPAFKGRLNDAQIQDVADYVLSKADAGW